MRGILSLKKGDKSRQQIDTFCEAKKRLRYANNIVMEEGN